MSERKPTYRSRILRVLLYIEEHLDGDLSRDRLAAVACFSSFHFHRLFTAFTGETLHKYIRRLRLERALHQLAYSEDTVVRIALGAGFETHEAFSRAFRQAFDMSPTEWRDRVDDRDPFVVLQARPSLTPPPIGDLNMDVRLEKLPAKRIAFLRHIGPYAGVGEKFQQLMVWAGPKGVFGPQTQVLGIYHDNPEVTDEQKLRSDAAVTVPDHIAAEGDIQIGEIAEGDYAIATHQGAYTGLADCYRWLYGVWLPQSGRAPADAPCFERYVNNAADTPEQELLTEIHLPLQ